MRFVKICGKKKESKKKKTKEKKRKDLKNNGFLITQFLVAKQHLLTLTYKLFKNSILFLFTKYSSK